MGVCMAGGMCVCVGGGMHCEGVHVWQREGHTCRRDASYWNAFLLPPTNEVCGKVIFSQACVMNSVQRGDAWSQGGAWSCGVPGPGGMPGPRGCLVPGEGLVPGGCLIQGGEGAWSGGCLVWGRMPGQGGRKGGEPPGMATAAGGTHPTGMHSCFEFRCPLLTIKVAAQLQYSYKPVS